jgi:predicted Zn-dependent protease
VQCLSVLLLGASLAACGTNPVTGKTELQLVSERQEIAIGQQNYAPARQSQGGDFVVDPQLTAYVQGVGGRLAAASDRPLPYEFVVLNNSVPNAWALPGGKIAVNRGLLYELNDEGELAAVLGHEIVHAAARHGAKSMERGLLLQGAVLAVGIGTGDSRYSQLYVGGALLAAQLIATRYGRDAELEADLYGMEYMKRAGYDPRAAVALQETFVRLSEGRNPSFIEGLFASHPPSRARVDANQQTAQRLGEGGETGRERYTQKTAYLRQTKPAYAAYDEGVKSLAKGNAEQAWTLAQQALAGEPREARFHELLGDVELSRKRYEAALGYYDEAIGLQPDFFKSYVQSGMALYRLGRKEEARTRLTRSIELLPTAPGYYLLGVMAEERGDLNTALRNYEAAAGSNSDIGKQAAQRYVRLDLPRNPSRYFQVAARADAQGNLYAVVRNSAPVPLGDVRVRVERLDASGRVTGRSGSLRVPRALSPGQTESIPIAGARVADGNELRLYRVVVEQARVVE